jgi:hypothetical protein
MEDSILFQCPNAGCGNLIKADATAPGELLACSCGTTFRIPKPKTTAFPGDSDSMASDGVQSSSSPGLSRIAQMAGEEDVADRTHEAVDTQDRPAQRRDAPGSQRQSVEIERLLPLIRVQRGLLHPVLVLFSDEIIFGLDGVTFAFNKNDLIPTNPIRLFNKIAWSKRIALKDIDQVTIIKPGTKKRSDKSWRVQIRCKFWRYPITLPYEDGHNILTYFEAKTPNVLVVDEHEWAHVTWRFRSAFFWLIATALTLSITLGPLGLSLPRTWFDSVLALIASFSCIGVFFLFFFAAFPRDSAYWSPGTKEAGKRKSGWLKGRREPFRSFLIGGFLKAAGIAWACFGFYWLVDQPWFQNLERHGGNRGTVFWLGIYMPFVLLIYLGYQFSQRIPKPTKNTDLPAEILYLRAFDDDQRVTLQPANWLARGLGVISDLPNAWVTNQQLHGARFRSRMGYIWNIHPVRILRLLFNKGVDTAEELLTAFFSRSGKVVAIGRPGQRLVTPGAERLYVEDDAWQQVVTEHLEEAQLVVVQPGISAGVRWEINKAFEIVQPQRLLFNLAGFWRRPNAFEDFLLTLPEEIQRRLAREIPHLDRPAFLYFERDWTPQVQLLSYHSPLLWTFLGNAVDLRYTLEPFMQAVNGSPSQSPRAPKEYLGHTMLAWLGVTAFFSMMLWGQLSSRLDPPIVIPPIKIEEKFLNDLQLIVEERGLRDSIVNSSMNEYAGKSVVPYSLRLRSSWLPRAPVSDNYVAESAVEFFAQARRRDSGLDDYWFTLIGGAAGIETRSDPRKSENLEGLLETEIEAFRSMPVLNGAQIRQIAYPPAPVDGRRWLTAHLEVVFQNQLKVDEFLRVYSSVEGTIFIYGTICHRPSARLDDFYFQLIEEAFDSISLHKKSINVKMK